MRAIQIRGVVSFASRGVMLLLLAVPAEAQAPKAPAKPVLPKTTSQLVRPPMSPVEEPGFELPPSWAVPSLRHVIDVLRTDPGGRELYLRSGGAPAAGELPSGSYATVLPNQIGSRDGGRLRVGTSTVLNSNWTLQAQLESNIVRIGVSDPNDLTAVVTCEDGGWYLFTLHLYNPQHDSFALRNVIDQYTRGGVTIVLDRTGVVPADADYTVPVLLEVAEPGSMTVTWQAEPQDDAGRGAILVLRAVTVDKIG